MNLHGPQKLYRHWEEQQWNPFEIDLGADAAQWSRWEARAVTSSTGCCRR